MMARLGMRRRCGRGRREREKGKLALMSSSLYARTQHLQIRSSLPIYANVCYGLGQCGHLSRPNAFGGVALALGRIRACFVSDWDLVPFDLGW